MPIDPRIPLMGQSAQGPSPTEVFSQIAQLQAMRQQAEERAEVAAEKRAVRERQKQIETAMQGAITLDPDGQPTVDFAKLVPHLPAPVLFEVKKVVDEGKKLAIDLRASNLTYEQKQVAYRGAVARGIAVGGYDQTLFETGIVSARRAGALSQAETDQLLSQAADPAFRKRTIDSAIEQAVALAGGQAPNLEKVTTVENGQEVTKFVTPTAGASYPTAPKAPAALSYQAKDVLLDGKPAMASFNPQTGTYTVNGQDVTARVRPIPPQGPGPEPLVAIIGLDGKPVLVPRGQAVGATPASAAEGGAKLSAGAQEDIATMLTVQDLGKSTLALGDKIKWRGTGPVGGRLGALEAQFGVGGQDPERLRNMLGNIQGTIAKLRGGTSFTPSEQALLDRYTPTVTDSVLQIKAKLKSLDEFITAKRENTVRVARGDYTPRDGAAPADGGGRKPGPNPFAKK